MPIAVFYEETHFSGRRRPITTQTITRHSTRPNIHTYIHIYIYIYMYPYIYIYIYKCKTYMVRTNMNLFQNGDAPHGPFDVSHSTRSHTNLGERGFCGRQVVTFIKILRIQQNLAKKQSCPENLGGKSRCAAFLGLNPSLAQNPNQVIPFQTYECVILSFKSHAVIRGLTAIQPYCRVQMALACRLTLPR